MVLFKRQKITCFCTPFIVDFLVIRSEQNKMRSLFKFLFLFLFSIPLWGWDINFSLTNRSEIEAIGGIIEGGEFTPEGWRVTGQFNRIQIPIPISGKPLTGWVRISVKNVPSDFPNRIFDSDDGHGRVIYRPWSRTLIAIGTLNNPWDSQNAACYSSEWNSCTYSDWSGGFRHKHWSTTNYCWSSNNDTPWWCNSSDEIHTLEHRWDSSEVITLEDGIIKGDSCDNGPDPGLFMYSDTLYIHIAPFENYDPYGGVNGDISGAIFFNLVAHIEEAGETEDEEIENVETIEQPESSIEYEAEQFESEIEQIELPTEDLFTDLDELNEISREDMNFPDGEENGIKEIKGGCSCEILN